MPTASYDDIAGQAGSLRATLGRLEELPNLSAERPWLFTGSGASFHAGTTAAGVLSAVSGVAATSAPASEVWMNPDLWVKPGAVVVALSRTGTTTETVNAIRAAAAGGATTVGISLAADAPVLSEADHGVALTGVGERGRVMTRSFANLLLASELLGARAAVASSSVVAQAYLDGAAGIPDAVEGSVEVYDEVAQRLAKTGTDHVVFLGSGPDVGLCRQATLQLQETSRLPAEAHAVLDYRHGPIAALTTSTTVVLLTTPRSLPADLVLAEDIAVLGGSLVAVGAARELDRFPDHADRVPVSGDQPLWLSGNVALPFLQLLAYHLTVARDADPESVRNLDRTKTPHVNPHVLADDLFTQASPAGP